MKFEEAYRQYFDEVYRFLCKLTGSRALAEELTGETFFKAMRAIDRFRGECELSVWLCQIAKNTYYGYLRKNKRIVSENELAERIETAPDVLEQVLASDAADRAKQQLHALPEPYREVFMWRALMDMSFAEIGVLFGKSANWACVTYHRARKMLLERMEEQDG